MYKIMGFNISLPHLIIWPLYIIASLVTFTFHSPTLSLPVGPLFPLLKPPLILFIQFQQRKESTQYLHFWMCLNLVHNMTPVLSILLQKTELHSPLQLNKTLLHTVCVWGGVYCVSNSLYKVWWTSKLVLYLASCAAIKMAMWLWYADLACVWGVAGSHISSIFNFWKNLHTFPYWLHQLVLSSKQWFQIPNCLVHCTFVTNLFCHLFIFVCFKIGSPYATQIIQLAWNSLCSPGWPQTCDPLTGLPCCWDGRSVTPNPQTSSGLLTWW